MGRHTSDEVKDKVANARILKDIGFTSWEAAWLVGVKVGLLMYHFGGDAYAGRGTCQRCKAKGVKLNKHHASYSKPTIRKLCAKCHSAADRNRRTMKGGLGVGRGWAKRDLLDAAYLEIGVR